MTSEERRQARYVRRQQKRQAKKAELAKVHDDFDVVFSYDNLYNAYKECRKGVAWKRSTQKYITQAPLLVYRTWDRLQCGTFRSDGFYEFDIRERGKVRHIRSVTMNERVVQRCLCDNALVPMIDRTFIYDNGATQKYKGYHFSMDRLKAHLQKYYRKHGNDGYILLYDFSKFFDRVDHGVVQDIMDREFDDPRIKNLAKHFVDCFGDQGMGLGSQVSQTYALASANRMDHFFKEYARIKYYGRYMDDGYMIHSSKEYLQQCLQWLKAICRRYKITLNEKKTRIVKLSHGFTWLKCRWFLTDTGKVVKKIYKRSVTKERQKLKKFVGLVEDGTMSYQDVFTAFQSWRAYARHFDAWHTIRNMEKLYTQLFVFPERNTDPVAFGEVTRVTPPRDGNLTKYAMKHFAHREVLLLCPLSGERKRFI